MFWLASRHFGAPDFGAWWWAISQTRFGELFSKPGCGRGRDTGLLLMIAK